MNSGCAARIAEMTAAQRSERLAVERGRVTGSTDPIDKTESYITISDILLSFASEAIDISDHNDLKTLLDQYVVAVQSARETMVNSNRDAERRPAGYKELEIAVRGQIRLLEDMSARLTLDERKPVEDAIAAATSVRDDMLRLLFPHAAPPT
jgi:hypothetical protein